ncbi:MAG TPA: aldehyde dehydrogenase family protein, partial [Candidatus Limnocylindrales bacterium]|nr:aldehyde dehydrogenase family protein [Candidatus Limnocylindrales bacterium]
MAVATLPAFRTKAFIDGAFRDAASGETFVTENPATGQPLAQIAAGDAADIDTAVRAARRAFDDGRWSRLAPAERKRTLLRFADLLEANLEELALLDSLEAGKPITDTREVDVPDAVHTFRWFAEAIDKMFDAVSPTGPDALGLIVREPVGVVGAVVPWNFPLLMATWKAAPALAAGNS